MAKATKRKLDDRDFPAVDLSSETAAGGDSIRARIAERAYQLYEQRGYIDGHDGEDWLEAERLVLAELTSQAKKLSKSPGRRKSQRAVE